MDLLNRNFTQFGVFSQNLSIDKQMVPYYGHFSTKMFMRNKPIKFGIKVRFLAFSQGYPFSFQVYTGKDGSSDKPLRERVVNTLPDVLKNKRSHAVYFDNFFSSTILCRDLAMVQLKYTGTIRQNKTQNCPFTSPAAMKKQERGTFEAFGDGMIALCQWNDNKPMCVVSNFKDAEPTSVIRRWSASKKSAVQIPQPQMVANYNKYMGGVDLLDRFLSDYRPRLRSKIWWWCLFSNFLNMSVVAAWRLHKKIGETMPHLQFRRDVVRTLMARLYDKPLRPGPNRMPVDRVRLTGKLQVCAPVGKQGRCKHCKKTHVASVNFAMFYFTLTAQMNLTHNENRRELFATFCNSGE